MTQRTQVVMREFCSGIISNFSSPAWRRCLQLFQKERFQPYFIAAFTLWLVGAVEIIQRGGGQTLDPRFWMSVAVLITVYSGIRIFRLTSLPPNIVSRKLSPALNEMISRIKASGLAIYPESNHEKQNGGYVIVGRSGVYAMAVKTRKVFGSRQIEYRNENELVLGGRICDGRPVQSAQAIADTLREKLHGLVKTRSAVKPIVVFLNEWRISASDVRHNVPVVTASEVDRYINDQTTVLSDSEIAAISAHLERDLFTATS